MQTKKFIPKRTVVFTLRRITFPRRTSSSAAFFFVRLAKFDNKNRHVFGHDIATRPRAVRVHVARLKQSRPLITTPEKDRRL